MHQDNYVHDDYSVETIEETESQILNQSAIDHFRTASFSYSTSIQTFDVLEAYTLKPDGSKIDVPQNNYQITVNQGKYNNPVFSDRTFVKIVFPDIDVNDTTHIKVKITSKEPMFPGHFSMADSLSGGVAYDDVKVSFDIPESIHVSYKSNEMTESTETVNNRQHIDFSYSNPKPIKSKRKNFSVVDLDKQPGYAISTFEDYAAIGRAYGARALAKVQVTERINDLATQIIGNATDKREKAKRLYDWVATNITYAGNCIGIGAVVPHDLDFILDNRMGDCKDHDTLLESLFKSQGIRSIPALINSGHVYTLPEIPRVSVVNHVITYIPEWNKFVDSTDRSQPFDILSLLISDKPVILADGSQQGLKTPATPIDENTEEIISNIEIRPDGSAYGDLNISMTGITAAAMRDAFRQVTPEQLSEGINNMFKTANPSGYGNITNDDPEPLLSSFHMEINFKKPDFVDPSGHGAFAIQSLFPTLLTEAAKINAAANDFGDHDVACMSGQTSESYVYSFPENVKIISTPEDIEINDFGIYYKCSHKLEENRLEVIRILKDETATNICSHAIEDQREKLRHEIRRHLSSPVVYKFENELTTK